MPDLAHFRVLQIAIFPLEIANSVPKIAIFFAPAAGHKMYIYKAISPPQAKKNAILDLCFGDF